jgi:hypothetical protein
VSLEETGAEPVLVAAANTDDFEIVKITDPFEQSVAHLFRSGNASYIVRESVLPLQWRLNSADPRWIKIAP